MSQLSPAQTYLTIYTNKNFLENLWDVIQDGQGDTNCLDDLHHNILRSVIGNLENLCLPFLPIRPHPVNMIHFLIKYKWNEGFFFLLDNMDQDKLNLILYSGSDQGQTPLQLSCKFGNYAVAKKLLKYYDHIEEGPNSPVLLAKRNGHKKLGQLMYLYYSVNE